MNNADSSYVAETYDPQGNVVQPVALYPIGGYGTPGVGNGPVRVTASTAYDAFGGFHGHTADGAGHDGAGNPAAVYEPAGFGGQFGYYHDYAGRYLLGHRFYDSFTGRFVTRDPIGYKGGINLYGFAGNNPVNESDPSGFDPYHLYYGPSGGYGWMRVWHNKHLVRVIQASNVTLRSNDSRTEHGDGPVPLGHFSLSAGPRHNWRLSDGRPGIHVECVGTQRTGIFIHSMKHRNQHFAWAKTEGCIRVQQDDLDWLRPRIMSEGGWIQTQAERWPHGKTWKGRYPERRDIK